MFGARKSSGAGPSSGPGPSRLGLSTAIVPADKPEYLNLKVKAQNGNETYFKIKGTTKLEKLMNTYCEKQSEEIGAIIFLYDGRRLKGTETPNELGMEEGDEIDAMLHQTGGNKI